MIKKQIILPREAFALGDDADTFLNVQLSRSETDIKNEKINNVFNVTEQINKERQSSLKFCIFGLIDSKFVDCGNIIIDVKDSQGLTLFLPKITTNAIAQTNISIKSFELTQGSKMSCNLYGKKKAAFSIVFEISKVELDTLNKEIIKAGSLPKTHTIDFSVVDIEKNIYHLQSVPYLFYDLEGNAVPFGTQTADIDTDGNSIEINNDFDFLYDRHWIRSSMVLPAPSVITFATNQINVAENVGSVFIDVALDQDSIYGIEEASIVVSADNTTRNPNEDYSFQTQRVKWAAGERVKSINVLQTLDDKYVESTESLEISLADITGCVFNEDSIKKATISIINEDYPSEIKFTTQRASYKSDVSSVVINFDFHKPLEVPNQSITVYITSKSTAEVGKDFSLNAEDNNVSEIVVDFEEGATGGSVVLYIFDNEVYDLTKLIQVGFKNPTQNIAISTFGSTEGQVMDIFIEDSLVTLWASFITINNPSKSIGPFKTPKGPDSLAKYKWSIDGRDGFLPITNNYAVTVYNDGDTVVYNNQLIPKNGIMETIFYTNAPSQDLKYDLPSNANFNRDLKSYTKAKYVFEYVCVDRFEVAYSSVFTNSFDFYPIIVATNKDAGPKENKKYYFRATLTNFKTNFAAGACQTSINTQATSVCYTNCVPFAGRNIYGSIINGSVVSGTFEPQKVVSQCTQFLPYGFGQLPSPPYNYNYINIAFRNFYPQAQPHIDEVNTLRLNSSSDIPKLGFVNLDATSNDTRNGMYISIYNNGDFPATISGTIIQPGQSYVIRGYEANFNTLIVNLPANESFNSSNSTLTVCNYVISVENVRYYNNGQPVGSPRSYVFDSTNTLETGSLNNTPTYFIVTEYTNINVPYQSTFRTSPVDCSTTSFQTNKLHPTTVGIRGILLNDSSSGFRRGYFRRSSNDLGLTCVTGNNVRIPFAKL